MKKTVTLLLVMLMTLLLSGCSVNNSMEGANNNTANATRSQRLQNISQKLDSCASVIESTKGAGSKVKKALTKAQKAQKKAMEHLTDNESGMLGLNHDGNYYVDKFEASVQTVINAMNADKAVRKEIERQNSLAADGSNTSIFNGAASTYIKYFIMGAIFLVALFLALALVAKAARGGKPTTAPVPAVVESTPTQVAIDTEEKPQVAIKEVSLLETSDSKFEMECLELGHDPEEVKEFFGENIEKAKTYISMEKSYKQLGMNKDYKELSKEA